MSNTNANAAKTAPKARKGGSKARKGGSKWIRPTTRLALYLRDGFRCAYCNRDLSQAPRFETTLDHVKAHHSGGDNSPSNLVCACRSCNSRRQDKPVSTYVKIAGLNPSTIWSRISRRRSRDLTPYRAEARRLIAERKANR